MKDEEWNTWHQRRASKPIDYMDLIDINTIVNCFSSIFKPDFIPRNTWFENLVEEVYKSRCVVAHMNELSRNNIRALDVRFDQWQNHIKAKLKKLP